MAGEIESPRIEQSPNPEPEGFVEGQAGLQARLVAAIVTGDRELLNPNNEIAPITPEAAELAKEDLSIVGTASQIERTHYWENARASVDQQRRYDVWAQETKAAFNTTEFFATEKGQQWSAFFEKLGVRTGSFTDEHARALYDKYFSPTPARDTVAQFVQDIYDVHTTQAEFQQNRDAIQWFARLFGDKSAQVMAQLADAGIKQPQEIADAANVDNRRNKLDDTEYDLLDFLYDPEVSLNRTRPAHLDKPAQIVSSVGEHAALAPAEPIDAIEEEVVAAPVVETAVTVDASVLPIVDASESVQPSTWEQVGSTFPFLTESGWNGLSDSDRQGLAALDKELSGALTLRTEEGKEAEYATAIQAIRSRYESLSPKLHNQVSAVLREVGIENISPAEARGDKQADAKEQVVVIGEGERPEQPWKNLGITEEVWDSLSEREQQNLVFLENKFKSALALRVGRKRGKEEKQFVIKGDDHISAQDRRQFYKNAIQAIERSYQVLPSQVKDQVLESLRKQLNLESLSATEQAALTTAAAESGEKVEPFISKLREETLEIFPELERRPEEAVTEVAAVVPATSVEAPPVVVKTWEEMLPSLGLGGISEEQKPSVLALLQEMEDVEKVGLHAVTAESMQQYEHLLAKLRAHYHEISDSAIRDAVLLILEHRLAPVRSDVVDRHMEQMGVAPDDINSRILQMRKMARSDFPELRKRPTQVVENAAVVEPAAETVAPIPEPEVIEGDVVESDVPAVEVISNENAEQFQKTVAEIKKYGDAIMPPSIEPISDDAIPHVAALLQMIPNVHITEQMLLENSRSIRQQTDMELLIPDLLDKKLHVSLLYPHDGDPLEVIFERTLPNKKKNKDVLFVTIHFSEEGTISGGRVAFGKGKIGIDEADTILDFGADGNVIPRDDGNSTEVSHIDYVHMLDEITSPERKNDVLNFRELVAA